MTNKLKLLFPLLSILFISFVNVADAQEAGTIRRYFNKNKVNVLSAGNNNNGDKGINVSTVHGLNFSRSFAAGIGIGLTGGNKYPSTIIPLFVNGTVSFADSGKLYLSGDLGASIATEDGVKGGLFTDISIGRKFRIGKFFVAPEIGYRYDKYRAQTLIAEYIDEMYIIRRSNTYTTDHINSISAGISFFF